jgi:hypothetical protein
MQPMRDQILARIKRLGEGKAFSAKDFLDIASRGTIDMALGSLTRNGTIRRIRRGLYDMPRINEALGGKLSPDIDEAARRRQNAVTGGWGRFSETRIRESCYPAWDCHLAALPSRIPRRSVPGSSGHRILGSSAFLWHCPHRKSPN